MARGVGHGPGTGRVASVLVPGCARERMSRRHGSKTEKKSATIAVGAQMSGTPTGAGSPDARSLVWEVDFQARDADNPIHLGVQEDPMLIEAGIVMRPSVMACHGSFSSPELAPVRLAQPMLASRFIADHFDCSPGVRVGTSGLLAFVGPEDADASEQDDCSLGVRVGSSGLLALLGPDDADASEQDVAATVASPATPADKSGHVAQAGTATPAVVDTTPPAKQAEPCVEAEPDEAAV